MKILSLNVAMLSVFFNLIPIGLKKINSRTKKIIEGILELDPDVIFMQELFDPSSTVKFIAGLKQRYPHYVIDKRHRALFGGVHSGLACFSKRPIAWKEYNDYEVFAGDSALARKGFLKVSIDGNIYVTTHLQAGVKDKWYYNLARSVRKRTCKKNKLESDEIRILQCYQIRDSLEGKTVIVGDFNINAYDGENIVRDVRTGSEMPENKILDNLFGPESDTYVGEPGVASEMNNDTNRIDYCIHYLQREPKTESIITFQFTKEHTDHRGIVCAVNN